MKRIFLDTNIIVDLLMQREGVVTSAKVLSEAKKEGVFLLVSVLTIANIAYILRKGACDNDCDVIVTRNKKDFEFSTIEILTPEDFC